MTLQSWCSTTWYFDDYDDRDNEFEDDDVVINALELSTQIPTLVSSVLFILSTSHRNILS